MKKQNGGQTATAALSMANTVNKAVREPQPFMSLGVDPSLNNSTSDTTTNNININSSNHHKSSSSSSSGIKIKGSSSSKSTTSSADKSKFARELENILSKELETRRDRETKMQQYTPR